MSDYAWYFVFATDFDCRWSRWLGLADRYGDQSFRTVFFLGAGFGFHAFGFVGHLYMPFAREPWLTVCRTHSGSSPTGGNTAHIMTKFIYAMAILYSTTNVTFDRPIIDHASNQPKSFSPTYKRLLANLNKASRQPNRLA